MEGKHKKDVLFTGLPKEMGFCNMLHHGGIYIKKQPLCSSATLYGPRLILHDQKVKEGLKQLGLSSGRRQNIDRFSLRVFLKEEKGKREEKNKTRVGKSEATPEHGR